MSSAIAFQNTTFDVTDRNGQPWLQARQIGQALGYSRSDAVLNLYERNKDEFTVDMTATIELMVGLTPQTTRIFSPRGCHLLAMFARTSVAKAFRVWVLDVLETLNKPAPIRLSTRTDPERKALTAAINAWVSVAPIHYAAARSQVNAHFGVLSVDELTVEQVKEAVRFVSGQIETQRQPQPKPLALPPAASETDSLIDLHFSRFRMLRSEMRKEERALYDTIMQHRGDVLKTQDARRSVLVNMHTVLDRIFYAVDNALDAAEFHAKSMCIMNRV